MTEWEGGKGSRYRTYLSEDKYNGAFNGPRYLETGIAPWFVSEAGYYFEVDKVLHGPFNSWMKAKKEME